MTYCALVVIFISFNLHFVYWLCVVDLKWLLIGFLVRFLAHVKLYNIISHLVPTALGHKLTAVSPFNQSWDTHTSAKKILYTLYVHFIANFHCDAMQAKHHVTTEDDIEKLSQPFNNLMNNITLTLPPMCENEQ